MAGVELGGCPLASAVSLTKLLRGAPLDALLVTRHEDHGSRRGIEGDTHLARPSRVVLLEDVITTGGSTLKAAEKLTAAGHELVGVAALVDRSEGGRETIEKTGLPVVALFARADFP